MSSKPRLWAALLAVIFLLTNSAGGGQTVLPILPPAIPHVVPETPYVVFLVGDIVHNATLAIAELVGRLVVGLVGETPNSIVAIQGDICNDESLGEECYDWFEASSWGELLRNGKLLTVPGNHDYLVNGGRTYYLRFPNSAGETGLGYQGVNHGPYWRIEALNTELDDPERREQIQWLTGQMQQYHKSRCLLAVMHRPPYSSGMFASPRARLLTDVFYQYGGDVVSASHDHLFNAMRSIRPFNGLQVQLDKTTGMHVFVTGTGGSFPYHERALKNLRYGDKHDEVVITRTPGILQLTLWKGRFEWGFVTQDGSIPKSGQGTGLCHDNPSGFVE